MQQQPHWPTRQSTGQLKGVRLNPQPWYTLIDWISFLLSLYISFQMRSAWCWGFTVRLRLWWKLLKFSDSVCVYSCSLDVILGNPASVCDGWTWSAPVFAGVDSGNSCLQDTRYIFHIYLLIVFGKWTVASFKRILDASMPPICV